jgi:hypothetical protein
VRPEQRATQARAKASALLGSALSANPAGLVPKMRAAALSDDERLAQHESRAMAAEGASGALGALMGSGARKGAGAAADFGATDEAKRALVALGGALKGGLLIALKEERLDVDGELAEGSASALAAALKARAEPEPVFAVLRYALAASAADDGAPAPSVLVLVSFCPEGTAVRKRMIHASAKPALRTLLAELEIKKSVETQDLDDVTDEWLAERVDAQARASDAAADEMLTARRPAPKGGRRVQRRPEDAAE